MKKTAVITGAAGFLGVHLCNRFLDEGYIVVGIDNFCTSKRDSVQFKDLLQRKSFYFREFDIRDEFAWQNLQYTLDDIHEFIGNKLKLADVVANFACPASPPQYMKIPIETLLTSVVGGYNALEFARKSNAVFLQASTSEVYGDAQVHPQPETYWGNVNSYGCRANYDIGKQACEALCYDYKHKLGVDARLVRIFNTYGPGMDPYDGRIITTLIRQAIKGEKLTVFGDGTQTRSFCYVDDLIEAIWRVVNLSKKDADGPINIGNDNEFSINELVALIKQFVNNDIEVEYKELPSDDPRQRRPDLTKAKKLLNGWGAKIDLVEGIKCTSKWMKTMYF